MWNKWLFKDLQELHLFQKPHQKETRRLVAGREMVKLQNINIRTPDTNDMNGDSVQADEDRGETYDSTSLPQSKKNSCKRSSRSLFQESGSS